MYEVESGMKTKRELRIKWGPNATPLSSYETTIPAGHPVTASAGAGCCGDPAAYYWAVPQGLKLGAIAIHDAIHYGIRIPAEEVE